MNIPLIFNFVYTTFIAAASFYMFQSAILTGIATVASFLTLAFFQGASILNKECDSVPEEESTV